MEALATARADPRVRDEANDQAKAKACGPVAEDEGMHRRVLVVDDDADNRRITGLTLERLGCRVDVAENGRVALAMTEVISYDVVFMDCQMPEMDGYEATQEIRRRETSGQHLPIIALTAHAMPSDRDKCLAAGMDDHISKPVRREVLFSALARWTCSSPEAAGTLAQAS